MDDQNQQKETYEASDISFKMFKKSLAFYGLLIFMFMSATTGLYFYFVPNNSFHYNKIQKSNIPYTSRLQSNATVQEDIVELRREQQEQKSCYRWLNYEKSKINIPIEAAMKIVLSEGIDLPKTEIKK